MEVVIGRHAKERLNRIDHAELNRVKSAIEIIQRSTLQELLLNPTLKFKRETKENQSRYLLGLDKVRLVFKLRNEPTTGNEVLYLLSIFVVEDRYDI